MLDLRPKSVCAVEMTLDMFTGHVKLEIEMMIMLEWFQLMENMYQKYRCIAQFWIKWNRNYVFS